MSERLAVNELAQDEARAFCVEHSNADLMAAVIYYCNSYA